MDEDDDQRQQHHQSANSDEIIKHFEQLDEEESKQATENYDSYDDLVKLSASENAAEGGTFRAASSNKTDKEDGELDDDEDEENADAANEDLIEYDTTFDLNPSVSATSHLIDTNTTNTKSEHDESTQPPSETVTNLVAAEPVQVESNNMNKIDEDDDYQDYDDEEFEDASTVVANTASAIPASLSPAVDNTNTNSNGDDNLVIESNKVTDQSEKIEHGTPLVVDSLVHVQSAVVESDQVQQNNRDMDEDDDSDDDDGPFGSKRLKIDEGLTSNAYGSGSETCVATNQSSLTVNVNNVLATSSGGNNRGTGYQLSPISSVGDPEEMEDRSVNDNQKAGVIEPVVDALANSEPSEKEAEKEASISDQVETVVASVKSPSEEANSGNLKFHFYFSWIRLLIDLIEFQKNIWCFVI